MKEYSQYIVSAFVQGPCKGNPAAVCIIENRERSQKGAGGDEMLPFEKMKQIAKENNLSETAFCICTHPDRYNPTFSIRWFTPGCEVPLCGHATLASSFILFTHYFKEAKTLKFQSLSGELTVKREYTSNHTDENDFILSMDFPCYELERVTDSEEFKAVIFALGLNEEDKKLKSTKIQIFKGIDYVALFEDKEEIINFKPNFEKIASIPGNRNLLITSRGGYIHDIGEVDFVSRCFFPKEQIDEDPVTGSAHCSLAPLWAKLLNKTRLVAYQASSRGGILHLELTPQRVIIAGRSAYSQP